MRWEPSTEKKFKTQLFLLSVIMGALVVTGSLFYIGYQKKLTLVRSQQTISAISSLKVDQLVQWNKERLSEVNFFSKSPSVLRFVFSFIAGEKLMEPQLRKTLEHMLSDNRYDDIALLNSKGEVLFSVTSRMHPIDSTNKVLLDRVFRTRIIVFRDFYLCPYENKARACYLAPIMDSQSRVVAGLFFMVDPYDFFYPHIYAWPVPSSSAQSYLIKKAPNAIDVLSPIPGCDTMNIPCRKDVTRLDRLNKAVLTGNDGFLEEKDMVGVNVLAYAQRVPGTEWVLISKVNKQELFADYYRIVGLAILLSLSLLFLLWVGIVWVFNKRQQSIYEELYKKSEDLFHSQEEFGATLYSIGEGVIATDDKGCVMRMNEVACGMTGWTESEAIGKPVEEIFVLFDPETRQLMDNPVHSVLQQEEHEVVTPKKTAVLISKSGTESYVSDRCAPIKGQDGKVFGVVMIIRDQTEEHVRKRLLEARLSLFEYATRHE